MLLQLVVSFQKYKTYILHVTRAVLSVCISVCVCVCMSFLPIRFPHKNLETTWRKWQRPLSCHITSTTLHHTNTQTFPLEHLSDPCCAPLWALTKPACSISVKAQWQLRSSCSSQASRRKKDTRTHTEQWASKEQVLMTIPSQSKQMHSGTYYTPKLTSIQTFRSPTT